MSEQQQKLLDIFFTCLPHTHVSTTYTPTSTEKCHLETLALLHKVCAAHKAKPAAAAATFT